ncbi:hypothetical protein [Chromobacterium amazonense]|uniref:Uncharacterized protein n=1 Tax=Chromobacterium amazonense TaxID=1382803 RepID=A0ABU8V062_9NEIS|nr:hypothetical protein [Chromobacterium amazonense]MDQ4540968.1 hypothetical protein [Chromobacterium amazonense]
MEMEMTLGKSEAQDFSGMNVDELIKEAEKHKSKERVALAIMRLYMSCVVVFGVVILYSLMNDNVSGAIYSVLIMIVICCLALIFNFPELARKHAAASNDFFDMAADFKRKQDKHSFEDWSVRVIKIKKSL